MFLMLILFELFCYMAFYSAIREGRKRWMSQFHLSEKRRQWLEEQPAGA
ncbi:hypothetical protein Goari_021340 [Gossypium aridum]|uniref:Uncharacterized protein n=1 Tax=Gossypium aridum TaxID=34290 RepID=A0A7J8YE09_GOSAI|nr:hypothetical protein [Gossypium aridum]